MVCKIQKKKQNTCCSYTLKHVAEGHAQVHSKGNYIYNGAMILACRLAQIPESAKRDDGDPNCEFEVGVGVELTYLFNRSECRNSKKRNPTIGDLQPRFVFRSYNDRTGLYIS